MVLCPQSKHCHAVSLNCNIILKRIFSKHTSVHFCKKSKYCNAIRPSCFKRKTFYRTLEKVCLLMLYKISPEVVHHFVDRVCRNPTLLSVTRFHILKAKHRNVDLLHRYQPSSYQKTITCFDLSRLFVIINRELQNSNTSYTDHQRSTKIMRGSIEAHLDILIAITDPSCNYQCLHAIVRELFQVDHLLWKIIDSG